MAAKISDKQRAKIMDTIIERLMDGKSLRKICESGALPDRGTILRWMNDDATLATTIARARDLQADALDDDIADVMQEIRDGTLDAQAGRVIIWAMQWRAAKMRPKRYGDKIDHNVTGDLVIGIRRNERLKE